MNDLGARRRVGLLLGLVAFGRYRFEGRVTWRGWRARGVDGLAWVRFRWGSTVDGRGLRDLPGVMPDGRRGLMVAPGFS